jgi:methionine sulfoxide reductase heme-binding subunit
VLVKGKSCLPANRAPHWALSGVVLHLSEYNESEVLHHVAAALRMAQPRLGTQALLLMIAIGITLAAYLLLPGQPALHRISIGTGYVGVIFLAAALIIGPLNILRGESNPLSTYLRRDIGIAAAIFAVAHTIVGLQIHMSGDFAQYFFQRKANGQVGVVRFDAFGIANHLGLIAVLTSIVLLTISNNLSLRNLGPRRWKGIQRYAYLAAGLAVVHGLVYQIIEHRQPAFIACLMVIAAAAAIMQFLGVLQRKGRLAWQRGSVESGSSEN